MSIQSECMTDAYLTAHIDQCSYLFSIVDRNLIKYVSRESATITNRITILGKNLGVSKQFSRIILKAVYSQRPNSNCLIAAHSHFLQSCIDAQMYNFATEIIGPMAILEVENNLSSLDYLKYFYYSGLCYIGTGNLSEALDNFNQVINVPSTAISEIVVCSFKKAKLLSLILKGSLYELPKLTSNIVIKFSKSDMPLYDNISKLYINDDLVGLNLLIEESSEALHIDQNYGLAKQVVASMNSNNVRKLTNTYITMSLKEISDRCVYPNDTSDTGNISKNLLIEMIAKNEISANIDEVTGLVKFGINKEENNHKFLALLEKNMSNTMKLSEKLRDMQKSILASPQYVSKVLPKASSAMDWEDDIHNKAI